MPARRETEDEWARRRRRERERRRRQRQQQQNLTAVLLLAVGIIVAVFCLYGPKPSGGGLIPPLIQAELPTDPPTEEPTQAPTDPPADWSRVARELANEPVISDITDLTDLAVPDYVDVQIIDVDGASRRGIVLEGIRDIVIHYVGNPGTQAWQNRVWYADSQSEVSSHFVVGLEGEVIQCIPLVEKSSASNHRNADTISIEVCHPDATGKFNSVTYASVVKLTAWLIHSCGLNVDNVIRHYDVTGKICPKYYVENEEAWLRFKADVAACLPG